MYKLKSIQSNIIGQSTNQFVDKYTFDYDYTSTSFLTFPDPSLNLKKLLLKKITKSGDTNNLNEYEISYTNQNKIFKKDSWGYYRGNDFYEPVDITQDVISSITYPTKGKVMFDFGENIYSHFAGFSQPIEAVTGEWIEHNNDFELEGVNSFNPNIKKEFFTILSPQTVKLHLDLGNLVYSNWEFNIYKQISPNVFSAPVTTFGMSWQSCISTSGAQCPNAGIGEGGEPVTEFYREVTLEPGTYYASLSGSYGITQRPVSYYLTASTKERSFLSYVTKKGGGLRINDIKYFDAPASTVPAKEFVYDYKDIENPQKSSGALVFPEPIFNYTEMITYDYIVVAPESIYYNAIIDTTTDFNILPSEKTQGSDVGYQYVTVKQIIKDTNNTITDKGKTVYKFRSPIDFPNPDTFSLEMPIVPISNRDYLRGQMIFEKKYDDNGKILSEVNNEYTTLEFTKLEGIKAKDNHYNIINPNYYIYNDYQVYIADYPPGGIPLTIPYKYFATYGITLPSEKTEKSYFYKNGIQSSITSTTNTLYNNLDYPTSVTQSFSDGETNNATYAYAYEKNNTKLINANMIGIPLETETKKNNKTISKVETKYDNPANLLPSSVISTDLSNTNSTEVTYDQYDPKGNLLQYTTRDGIPTTIIWGYNSTQPIAKIVGYPYFLISGLVGAIITASDEDALNPSNEGALIIALDNFRNLLQLKEFQITTYTYDPLIGVTSITPPSGIREIYKYNSANRLENIKDINGKLIKEFKYNYKH
ncbi:hypothetical protein [Chryseobacterium balustinum]|uniref:RHS repeat protein n=4 Tax=Chryseobacterium TaxID=59732 RepID=A0AAX2IPI9_9FLAO|nr:hypothetical protein [Chryseobacterium balustinum]AZB28713.1 hypothetical protein EB354_05250 [Chryseobacterium balustinum]SKC07235.1 hypothetical protein SAMN05421800_12654 [Chryseobacterium balustinum]SQA91850.1 Uncharacterised protein [Chryseobacterium balustinum]